MKTYQLTLKNFFDYDGRANRKELGIFILFNIIIIPLVIVGGPHFIYDLLNIEMNQALTMTLVVFLMAAYLFLLIGLPMIIIRRLHDVGKSGYYIFLPLLPLIGLIWLIILLCSKSDGENEFDSKPLIKF
jgi:uncharacterized membrane protein YhaH (DUF805 family)